MLALLWTEHFASSSSAPTCPTECGNMAFGKSLHTDTFKLGLDQFIEIYTLNHPYLTLVYQLAKEAIMSGGPVPAGINADAGFMAYSSGVYTHSCTQQPNHEVTAIGWGSDHWIVLNSLGPGWGESGSFRVGWCVLTDFTIPKKSLAGSSGAYGFPLEGSTATPADGLNPSTVYSAVMQRLGDAWGTTKNKGCICTSACANTDNDPNGVWCFTDTACQGTNWGYCWGPTTATPTTATTATTTTKTTTTTTTTTTKPPQQPPPPPPQQQQQPPPPPQQQQQQQQQQTPQQPWPQLAVDSLGCYRVALAKWMPSAASWAHTATRTPQPCTATIRTASSTWLMKQQWRWKISTWSITV